jgi:hypothetical protein
MARDLLEPILDGGIRNPYYFEGRLLTAEALRADQQAHRARQRRLGRAIGAGVVEGLFVTVESRGSGEDSPVLGIAPGLAINGKGDTLEIATCESIGLTRAPRTPGAAPCLFRDCIPPTVGIEATGEGFYVLVLSPVSGYGERAPMSGLGEPKAGAGCGSRWVIEGVQLRLEPLDPLAASGVADATRELLQDELLGATAEPRLARLRNVLAHLCLGTEQLPDFAADPFARAVAPGGAGTRPALTTYGVLDDLAAAGRLTDCDVPLALLDWRLDGLSWLDNWAVRRRPAPPATAAAFPTLSAGRRRAEAEAAFLQFQEQLAGLLRDVPNPAAIRARESFRWLPPAGLLPLAGGARPGIAHPAFWTGLTVRGEPVPGQPALYIDGARLGELLAAALAQPPIDLESGEVIWAYRVRQNHPLPATGESEPPYLVFASGHLPFIGTARFDLARWDRSNYGLL